LQDPPWEAILLADKAKALAAEAKKDFLAVLNKVDDSTEPLLRQELSTRGIQVGGTLSFSAEITRANLVGNPLEAGALCGQMEELVGNLSRNKTAIIGLLALLTVVLAFTLLTPARRSFLPPKF
jgi:CO dehydrogenase maturation factor